MKELDVVRLKSEFCGLPVGANRTIVLVNDPTKGYGIFIDNMLDMAE